MIALDMTYGAEDYPGQRFRVLGWCMVWVPDDEHGEEGKWIPDPSSGQVILVEVEHPETEYYIDVEKIYELNGDGTRKLPEAVFSD